MDLRFKLEQGCHFHFTKQGVDPKVPCADLACPCCLESSLSLCSSYWLAISHSYVLVVAFFWLYLLFLRQLKASLLLLQFIRKWPWGRKYPCPVWGAAMFWTPPEDRVSTGRWRLLGQSMAGFVCSVARAGVQQTVLMLVPYSLLVLAPAHCALCFFSPCFFSLKLCGVTDDASKSLSHGFRQCPSMEEIMWVWEWMGRPFNIQVTLRLMSAPVFNCSILLILLNTYWYLPLSNS